MLCSKKNTPQHADAVWLPPPVGIAKINVDAATSKNNNVEAVAAIARSGDGGCLGASAVVFDGTTNAESLLGYESIDVLKLGCQNC
jgi:hypothetical protein